jgi:hypothetical protein
MGWKLMAISFSTSVSNAKHDGRIERQSAGNIVFPVQQQQPLDATVAQAAKIIAFGFRYRQDPLAGLLA